MLSAMNPRSIGSVLRVTAAALLVGLASVLVACGGSSSNGDPKATLTSISLAPNTLSLAAGATQQYSATGVYSDGSKQDVTAQATWSSSADGTLTITAAALATGVAPGSATITATLGGVSGSATVTVTPAALTAIEVTPATPSAPAGVAVAFSATGRYSDGTTHDETTAVTWSSSNTSVATESNVVGAAGVASALAVGSTTITATLGSVSGSTTLTVTSATLASIAVTPMNPSIAKGASSQLAATGTYSDNTKRDLTNQATWSSSASTTASVSNAAGTVGVLTGVAVGSATITATIGNVSGSTSVTVTAATLTSINVTPANLSLAKGTTQQYTATAIYSDSTRLDVTQMAVWASLAPAVASVSNAIGASGVATAVAAGQTTISATLGGVTGSTQLTVTPATLVAIAVTPANSTLSAPGTSQFTATGTYSDSSTQQLTTSVTWASSDTSVATISNAAGSRGLASALAAGSTTISATLSGVSGSTPLTVTTATLQSIAVTPSDPTLAAGVIQQLTATGNYSDGSTHALTGEATWSSSSTAIATVGNSGATSGQVMGVAAGTSTVSATYGGVTGSTLVTVTPATLVSIAVTPVNASVSAGSSQQYVATGTYSDASTQVLTSAVTWSSSNTAAATISNAAGSYGLASSAAAGTTTITATLSAVSGSTQLTVTPATLVSIAVTPLSPSVALGATTQFAATGTYSDSSTQTLTTTATWSSSNTSVATISNAAGSNGLATPVAIGTTMITATVGGVTSPAATLTVAAAPPQYVYVVNNSDASISQYAIGADGTLSAVGTPVSTGLLPVGIAFDPIGQYAYVPGSGHRLTYQFSVGAGGVLSSVGNPVATGIGPFATGATLARAASISA